MNALKRALVTAMGMALVGCSGGQGGKPVATVDAEGSKVTLSTSNGQLTNGPNELTLSVTDASDRPLEIQPPTVTFTMPAMPNMPEMKSEAHLEAAGQPGAYKGTVELGMKGTWQTRVSFKDAAGLHGVTFSVQAQ